MLFDLGRCAVTLFCKWDSWISIENVFFLVLDGIEACLLGQPAHGAVARQKTGALHTLIPADPGVYTLVEMCIFDAGEWLLTVHLRCKDSPWWITITEFPAPVGQAPSDI